MRCIAVPPVLVLALALGVASCGARTGLGDFGSVSDASVDAAVPCTDGTFPLSRATPAVMFVLDRSRSMNSLFSRNQTRWDVLTDALASALPPVDRTMAIGALAFPTSSTNDSCTVTSAPDIAPAVGNTDAVVTLMRTKGTAGATPTADAIDVAGNALGSVRAARTARTMVLATDGGPDCNSALDPSTCRCVQGNRCTVGERCLDEQRTVDRITSFASRGIPTYVIGIQSPGDTSTVDVLDAMAVAGGRPQSGAHSYYGATSASELDAALVAIRDQVGACTYLTSSVPNAQGTITVTVKGAVVPYDPSGAHGWRWSDETNGEIVFGSDVCSRVGDAGAAPKANVTCAVPDAGSDVDAD